MYSPLLGAAD
jgi:predicted transcriptional regulator